MESGRYSGDGSVECDIKLERNVSSERHNMLE